MNTEPATLMGSGSAGADHTDPSSADAANTDPGSNVLAFSDPESGERDVESERSLLPVAVRPAGAWWAWYPLHGGTGISTLSTAVRGGIDLGGLPAEHGWPNLPVVAICRSHHAGLTAAQEFARANAENPDLANVVGLVIVADAPRLPRQLVDHVRLVSGAYTTVWRIPWVRAWRVGEPVTLSNVPRQAHALLTDLAEQCDMPLTGKPTPNSNTNEGDTQP